MVPGIPGFGAAGSIVRKEIPLDTTPVCCVQYGGVPVNIACYWPCTQDLYASLALTDKLFLPVQLELIQCFRLCLPPEAVELLPVEANHVAQVAAPAENGAEGVMECGELHVIGDRDQADDHRTYMT